MIRSDSRLTRALEYGVVVLLALGFAASYGFNYPDDNQVVYFLKSLTVADRSVLHADWFTNQTTQYHRVFIYFGALLIKLNKQGWGIGITQFLLVTMGAVVMYRIARRLVGAAVGLGAYALLLSILFITRTSSVGASYLFDQILQPSTLGALGSIAGAMFFIEERWLASGICVAAGGAFHANYLVLAYPLFGLAHLALGFHDWKRRLLQQFGPLVAVTLALSPLLLAASHTKASPEAQDILFSIRSPHHYNPVRFERNFMPFAAWQLLAFGAGYRLFRTPAGKRMGALLCGLLLTIWTGTLLTTLYEIPKVTQIFVWRFAPNADVLCQIMVACSLAQALAKPSLTRLYPGVAIGAMAAGLGAIGLYFHGKSDAPLPQLLLLFAGLAVAARVVALGFELQARFAPAASPQLARVTPWLTWLPLAIGAFLLYREAPARIETGLARSVLLKEQRGSQADLFEWLRDSSPKDAVYLTPPDLEDVRYMGQRAIVVDWKAVPLIPTELLGWYERLCDVTGRTIKGRGDLGGYNSLDPERLAMLRQKYHPDFVVVRKGNERRFADLPVVYQNGGYSVLKLSGAGATP